MGPRGRLAQARRYIGPRRRLAQARLSKALRAEIDQLVTSGDIAHLHPVLNTNDRDPIVHEVAKDVVADFIQTYGIAVAGTSLELPAGDVLLGWPLGLLEIPARHEDYLARVGPKTRNIIRKPVRVGYEFAEFSWNDHLDDVFRINTSAAERSGGPMRGWYTQPVEPRPEAEFRRYYGAFKNGTLYGYLHLVVCGDFGFFRHFLGHAEHLPNGIMNGLISWTVERYTGSELTWLKYGALGRADNSLNAFKRRAGFTPYATVLDLAGEPGLVELSKLASR